jgi:sialate O-acetylesterase
MVKLWRSEIGLGDIPFLSVEIAPYAYDGDQEGCSAFLREQQYKAQKLIPNYHLVSTNDLVEDFELHNIHPRQKQKVGQRLCWMALNRCYGLTQVCCAGPRYKDLEVKGDSCFISFYDLQMGICRNYDIQGFEIAGPDKVFYPAETTMLRWQTNEVVVHTSHVKNPVAVRYCFKDFEVGNLIGGNELPAFPFRTDNW